MKSDLRRRFAWACAACLASSTVLAGAATNSPALDGSRRASLDKPQKPEKDNTEAKRPKLTLKAQPVIAMSPARIVLTAELVGGADDYEDYYCPTVEWDWGDGTESSYTNDCNPYEAGKSEIKRRFTKEHVFRAGAFRVSFRLKRREKAVAFATVSIHVRPGLRDTGQ